MAIKLLHDLEQAYRTTNVILIVLKWFGHGFADSFESCKVDAGSEWTVSLEDFSHFGLIPDIAFDEYEGFLGLAGNGENTLHGLHRGIGEIVNDYDLVETTLVFGHEDLDDGVGADEAHATGDEEVALDDLFLFCHMYL